MIFLKLEIAYEILTWTSILFENELTYFCRLLYTKNDPLELKTWLLRHLLSERV